MRDLLSYYVLDRSGSMHHMWSDTVAGLQAYVAEQAAAEGNAWLTLHAFDEQHLVPFEAWACKDIDVRQQLREADIKPRSCTALHDAIGYGILRQERLLAERPWFDGVVQFVVQTDGVENVSMEYSREAVCSLIEQKRTEGWEFLFMGANIDAALAANKLNIPNSVQYHTGTVKEAYRNFSSATLQTRNS